MLFCKAEEVIGFPHSRMLSNQQHMEAIRDLLLEEPRISQATDEWVYYKDRSILWQYGRRLWCIDFKTLDYYLNRS